MKKILFTALAVVVFSGAAMAGAQEAKEVKKGIVVKGDLCQEFAIDFIEEMDPNNEMSAIDANNAYQDLLGMCYSFQ
ncbi:polyhydroxyalkanoate synthesis regulator phasin [Flavobacterium sp. CG_23.5]|uniref:hypothetical protein n=1 Tax=unclassified Flavobacterium TaxID=196869 RepID=UPI0018C99FF6|nr:MULTISPECIES: hypothetical protein [unclassified Flavobacterium]MBG6110581.1 polyhydroxyalkanoate synthesis regulator phasin [Flavobacterium sp. CG_9.10]MBP2283994.1 polyhydroxyalkanoate synthesis regulator phasin [Flavobacterium sp. CG_23.5]